MSLEEIEQELYQFISDSKTVVSIRLKKKELSVDDIDDEISRLIVEKIMERFFVASVRDGVRGIDLIDAGEK